MSTTTALAKQLNFNSWSFMKLSRRLRDETNTQMELSRHRLHRIMSAMDINLKSRDVLDRVFTIHDRNGTGKVDFFEFTMSITPLVQTLSDSDSILFAFNSYCTEDHSNLSREDIAFILKYYTFLWRFFGDAVPDPNHMSDIVKDSFEIWADHQVSKNTGINADELVAMRDFWDSLVTDPMGFVSASGLLQSLDGYTNAKKEINNWAMRGKIDMIRDWVNEWTHALSRCYTEDSTPHTSISKGTELLSFHNFLERRALSKEFDLLEPFFQRTSEDCKGEPELAVLANAVINGIHTPEYKLFGTARTSLDTTKGNSSTEVVMLTRVEHNSAEGKNNTKMSSGALESGKEDMLTVGNISICWMATLSPEAEEGKIHSDDTSSPEKLQKEPCLYHLEITGFENDTDDAVQGMYCKYSFFGKTFETERVLFSEQEGFSGPVIYHFESEHQFDTTKSLLGTEIVVQVFILDNMRLPDMKNPSVTETVQQRWVKWCNPAPNEDKYMSFLNYKKKREKEGIVTEPIENEWLDYKAILNGTYHIWFSRKI